MALGALAWWALSRGLWTFPIHLEERLESAVSSTLLQTGVTDRDIQSTLREEHLKDNHHWIQTSRVVDVPPTVDMNQLKSALIAVATRLRAEPRAREDQKGGWILDIYSYGELLERIVLRPVKAFVPGAHKVAIVIDDVSGNPNGLQKYFDLDIPLTFAIFPMGKNSRMFADLLKPKRDRYEYILHLPLEPHKSMPEKTPWTLLVAMPPAEKERLLAKHLNDVPGATGVSNHTGSAFTENRESMKLVLKTLKNRHLFFFDSRTSLATVGYSTAKAMGIPTALNRVFLDNQDDAQYIEKQLETLLETAKKREKTAAIGHYRRKHLAGAMAHVLPEFKKNNIEFVTLPNVLENGK